MKIGHIEVIPEVDVVNDTPETFTKAERGAIADRVQIAVDRLRREPDRQAPAAAERPLSLAQRDRYAAVIADVADIFVRYEGPTRAAQREAARIIDPLSPEDLYEIAETADAMAHALRAVRGLLTSDLMDRAEDGDEDAAAYLVKSAEHEHGAGNVRLATDDAGKVIGIEVKRQVPRELAALAKQLGAAIEGALGTSGPDSPRREREGRADPSALPSLFGAKGPTLDS